MTYSDSCSTIFIKGARQNFLRSTKEFRGTRRGAVTRHISGCNKRSVDWDTTYWLRMQPLPSIDRAHQRLGIKAVACFGSQLEFTRDRTQEARKRDIDLPLWQEVSEYLTSKVDNVVAGTKASLSSKNRHRNKQRCVIPLFFMCLVFIFTYI
jgi:predicted nucleotidyltransferase